MSEHEAGCPHEAESMKWRVKGAKVFSLYELAGGISYAGLGFAFAQLVTFMPWGVVAGMSFYCACRLARSMLKSKLDKIAQKIHDIEEEHMKAHGAEAAATIEHFMKRMGMKRADHRPSPSEPN